MNPGKNDRWALVGAWLASLVTAALGAGVGVVLAGLFLAVKPVETVKALPKAEDRVKGQVYFEPGTRNSNNARTWSQKKRLLLQVQATELTFNEDELNSWFGISPVLKKDKEPVEALTYQGLNFRINEGRAQVACTVQYNGFSSPIPFIVQATGDFAKQDDVWLFAPQELWVGSFPVHRFPYLMSRLMSWQKAGDGFPEAALKVREHVAELSVVERQIHVRIQ